MPSRLRVQHLVRPKLSGSRQALWHTSEPPAPIVEITPPSQYLSQKEWEEEIQKIREYVLRNRVYKKIAATPSSAPSPNHISPKAVQASKSWDVSLYHSLGCLKMGWDGKEGSWARGWKIIRGTGGLFYRCLQEIGDQTQTSVINAQAGICSCRGFGKGKWKGFIPGCPHLEMGACRGWLTSYAMRAASNTLPCMVKVGKWTFSRIIGSGNLPLPHIWEVWGTTVVYIINMELNTCACGPRGQRGVCEHIKVLRQAFLSPTPPYTSPRWEGHNRYGEPSKSPKSILKKGPHKGHYSGMKVGFLGPTRSSLHRPLSQLPSSHKPQNTLTSSVTTIPQISNMDYFDPNWSGKKRGRETDLGNSGSTSQQRGGSSAGRSATGGNSTALSPGRLRVNFWEARADDIITWNPGEWEAIPDPPSYHRWPFSAPAHIRKELRALTESLAARLTKDRVWYEAHVWGKSVLWRTAAEAVFQRTLDSIQDTEEQNHRAAGQALLESAQRLIPKPINVFHCDDEISTPENAWNRRQINRLQEAHTTFPSAPSGPLLRNWKKKSVVTNSPAWEESRKIELEGGTPSPPHLTPPAIHGEICYDAYGRWGFTGDEPAPKLPPIPSLPLSLPPLPILLPRLPPLPILPTAPEFNQERGGGGQRGSGQGWEGVQELARPKRGEQSWSTLGGGSRDR